MGRSVSYPAGYSVVTFKEWHQPELEEGETTPRPAEEFDWEDFTTDLTEYAPTLWPSLGPCDVWLGNENHALLENSHCYIGVSEYCGLASLWIVPKENEWGDVSGLAANWCEQIADLFVRTFGELSCVGVASNGEAFYRQIRKDCP
jgi:hypothetical protein